jgi:predicted DNA-binding transcriptional regulator YafY
LQNHRYWPGHELASRLEVSIRTLRRDIDRLRELGYPVLANRGVYGGYQLEAGAAMPPLLLDDEEAVGLAVALQTAAQQSVAGVAESSLRALAKLTQVMPPRLRSRVEALRAATDVPTWSSTGSSAPADPQMLVTIALACRDTERLNFEYVSAAGERSERLAEPVRLVSLNRRWYLVAYDLDRQDWRSFRLDRMDGVRRTGSRFRPRRLPAEDAVTYVRGSIGKMRTQHEVEVMIAAPAETARARLGRWATIEEVEPVKCRMTMRAESLDWPAMALGALGAEFDVIRPPELVDMLGDWAARFGHAAAIAKGRFIPHPPDEA